MSVFLFNQINHFIHARALLKISTNEVVFENRKAGHQMKTLKYKTRKFPNPKRRFRMNEKYKTMVVGIFTR
jgi:hypothetical protein